MSGHSKWATIRHKKGAQDAKRGKIFTKMIKEITVAARLGGGDIESNPRLRTAVIKAKAENMPKDNIERAIKKGTGDLEGVDYVELTYEAYAPGGVAMLINTLTDNKNRTAADIRNIVTKNGGNLGESGSVTYLFSRKGIVALNASDYNEDDVIEVALEAGAEDVSTQGESIEIICEPEIFNDVVQAVESAGMNHTMAEITMIPETTITLSENETRKVLSLVEKLEDNDDVQSVATNLDIPDGFQMDEE
ncbi:MAG: YebC/PmpR family DNA-binding transcriptional regulator [Spirochaetales bacterium]|nr:YebC/PmpR family DNA-binding transcriptional regulator [Spirochaetales bacterium]